MAKKDKASGKKRDVQAAAAASEKPLKKAKQDKKAEEPPAASEEESEELEIPEDFEEGSEGSDSEDGEPSPAELWQLQLEKRAQELNAFVCLVGNMEKQEEGGKDKGEVQEKSSKGKGGGDDDGDDEGESSGDDESDESDDEEPSVEKLEAMTRLFLPKKTEEYLDSITELLHSVGCTPPESEEEEEEEEDEGEGGMSKEQKRLMAALMGASMRMLNTKHSLPMQAIIKDALKQVDKAIKSKEWEQAFCRWAAVLLAVTDEAHWYADTEDSDAVVAIWKQLNKQWGQIKKHSTKDLGGPSCEGGKSPDVKHTLEHMLSRLGDGIRDMEVYDI